MAKAHFNYVCAALLLCTAVLLVTPVQAQVLDGVPQLINYQGRLTGTDGNVVADGEYLITFTIWDDSLSEAPSNRKWISPDCPVLVINGLFNCQLGSRESLPPWTMTNEADLWLGIKVGDDPELSPRTRLSSAPYAYKAWQADYAKYADSAGIALTPNRLIQADVETLITIGRQITIVFPATYSSPPSLAAAVYVMSGAHAGKTAYIQNIVVSNDQATLDLQAWTGAEYQDVGDSEVVQLSWVATGTP